FRVHDTALNRGLAIKVLDLGLTPSSALAERFVREARTIAHLEHANIVPIYKVGGFKNEVLYIVMRCVDGPSLRQLLEKERRLTIGDAARIARQVADALAYAHGRGIVHRDVKPDNILIDSTGRVVVTDFGIAKAAEAAASQLTTEGMVVGTPQYMSPEQATGERTDGRSDIYSLGIVLYQMLAGEPPFDGESAQSILMKQTTATSVPMTRMRTDVSQALAAVLDRMLGKDPAERYQTAEEVSRALVGALPTAARDRVKLRYGWMSTAIKSLVGVGMVGCLVVVAFAAGAAVVAWAVLSGPPRLDAAAPFPDSLTAALRRRGALLPRDTGLFAFIPDGPQDSVLFLVGKRRVAVVTPYRLAAWIRLTSPGVLAITPSTSRTPTESPTASPVRRRWRSVSSRARTLTASRPGALQRPPTAYPSWVVSLLNRASADNAARGPSGRQLSSVMQVVVSRTPRMVGCPMFAMTAAAASVGCRG